MLGKARLEEMKMIIKQTNLNLVYPRIMEYRKKFANSEEVLQTVFSAVYNFANSRSGTE